MKLKLYLLVIALSAWSLQSCDSDDESISVPIELQNAFSSKYPNAGNVNGKLSLVIMWQTFVMDMRLRLGFCRMVIGV